MKANSETGFSTSWFSSCHHLCTATIVLVATVFLVMASGCGGSSKHAAASAAISSFTTANGTSSITITSGTSTTLSWTSTDATSLSINGTAVTGTSLTVSPTSTTTYTLTAAGSDGTSVTQTVTITVVGSPSIGSFTTANGTSSITITSGTSTTLNWTTTNAASLSINGTAVTGTSTSVTPTAATTYTLTATNAAGTTTTKAVTVTVVAAPSLANFKASPNTITSGGSSTLSWSVSGDTTLSLTVTPPSGSATPITVTAQQTSTSTGALTATGLYTYKLTATNAAGTVSTTTATVTVVAVPVISFTGPTSPIAYNTSATLNWTVTGASSLSISGIGTVTCSSTVSCTGSTTTGNLTGTTSYTLTATDPAGDTYSAQTTVEVLTSISSFTSSPYNGGSATLSWTIAGATSSAPVTLSLSATPAAGGSSTPITITGNTITVSPASGSTTVTPTVDTTYVLTATVASVGNATASLTVKTTPDITSFLVTLEDGTTTSPASTSGGTVYLTPVFSSGSSAVDTAVITNDQDNTSLTVTSGTAYPVIPSKTTTYTLSVTKPSTSPSGNEVRTLRVIVGDITAFSGIGNSSSSALNSGFSFSDTSATATTAQYRVPYSLTTDTSGNVYFTDSYGYVVEELDTTGTPTRVAGVANTTGNTDNTTTSLAKFIKNMRGIAIDSARDIFVGDYDRIRKISGGEVTTLAGAYARATTEIDGAGATVAGFNKNAIVDVALDSLGELIVAEYASIRVVDSSAVVTTLAGKLNVSIAAAAIQDGTGLTGGGAGTALFYNVSGIAIDTSTDTIYLTDGNTIRKMVPNKTNQATTCLGVTTPGAACWAWTVSTWVNPTADPTDITTATWGGIAGHVDGSASAARLSGAMGIARASDGTLFVADAGSYIRRITPAGVVDTIAGDGGTCTSVSLCTLPNMNSTTAEALPGITYAPLRIAVDPTSEHRLFFTVSDVDSVFTMPY
jgi:hypothetical protein